MLKFEEKKSVAKRLRESVGLLSQPEKRILNSCDCHLFYISHAVLCMLRTVAVPVTRRILQTHHTLTLALFPL